MVAQMDKSILLLKLAKAARREEGDGKGWRGRFVRLLDRPAIFPIRASSMPSRAGVDHISTREKNRLGEKARNLWRFFLALAAGNA
jgi:hypothetical protein